MIKRKIAITILLLSLSITLFPPVQATTNNKPWNNLQGAQISPIFNLMTIKADQPSFLKAYWCFTPWERVNIPMPINVHLFINNKPMVLQRGAYPTTSFVKTICNTPTPTYIWYTQFRANYFQPGEYNVVMFYTSQGQIINAPNDPYIGGILYWQGTLVVQ